MASRHELLQQAIDECARIDARYRAECDEIQAQRWAALLGVPAVAAAIRTHDKAVTAAAQAWDRRAAALRERAALAELEWPDIQAAAEAKTESAWRAAVKKADDRKAAAVQKVERDFEAARQAAASVTGPALDARRRSARRARDDGFAEAAREHQESVQAAWITYQVARLEAQDAAIAYVERARLEEDDGIAAATADRDAARQAAATALEAVIEGDPLACSIAEAFSARLQHAEAEAEAAKAAVMARL